MFRDILLPVDCCSISRLLVALVLMAYAPSRFLPAQEKDDAEAKLEAEIHAALKAANPDYQNGGTFKFKDGRLISISLMRCKGLTDLSPLQKFPLKSVTSVNLYNSSNIEDISPLRGCPLTTLNLERCNKISDLSPLKGMPLKWFRMYACSKIKDLSPLEGMPLEHLDIGLNPLIEDLSPLKEMPLHDLRIDNCPKITDLSMLEDKPLTLISLFGCKGVTDFSVLGSWKLETLYFDPKLLSQEELQLVRNMESLQKIGTSWADYRKELSPAEFWKRYDEQK